MGFLKNHIVWNKGKSWSQETKDRISLSKRDISIKHEKQFKKGHKTWNKGTTQIEKINCKGCDIIFDNRIAKPKEYCSHKCYTSNHKVWNKGIPMGLSTKLKLKEALKQKFPNGKPLNEGNFKRGQLSKEKHPLWKGGVSSTNELIRKSIDYKIWRKRVFQRDNYTCQWCGIKDCYLEAHHIKRFAIYPELRLDLTNGITLCKPCHNPTRGLRSGGD